MTGSTNVKSALKKTSEDLYKPKGNKSVKFTETSESISSDNTQKTLNTKAGDENFLTLYMTKLDKIKNNNKSPTDFEMLCVPENADAKKIKDHYKFISSMLEKYTIMYYTYSEDILMRTKILNAYNKVQQSYKNIKDKSLYPKKNLQTLSTQEKKEDDFIDKHMNRYKAIKAQRSMWSKFKRKVMGEYLSEHEFKAISLMNRGEEKAEKAISDAKKKIEEKKNRSR